jgi:hypothetical protein
MAAREDPADQAMAATAPMARLAVLVALVEMFLVVDWSDKIRAQSLMPMRLAQ